MKTSIRRWVCPHCSYRFTVAKEAVPYACPRCLGLSQPVRRAISVWLWGILAILGCNLLLLQ